MGAFFCSLSMAWKALHRIHHTMAHSSSTSYSSPDPSAADRIPCCCVPIATTMLTSNRHILPEENGDTPVSVWASTYVVKIVTVRSVYKPYYFNQRTIFFYHNKSVNSTFNRGLSAKRTRQRFLVGSWLCFACLLDGANTNYRSTIRVQSKS